mmetsp:Transcript_16932/g.68301  ORF Transcript_16932/g.68301 Transcript_16932/m.68301 type:complete len:214 (-) Transcript_16932:55-696(-)
MWRFSVGCGRGTAGLPGFVVADPVWIQDTSEYVGRKITGTGNSAGVDGHAVVVPDPADPLHIRRRPRRTDGQKFVSAIREIDDRDAVFRRVYVVVVDLELHGDRAQGLREGVSARKSGPGGCDGRGEDGGLARVVRRVRVADGDVGPLWLRVGGADHEPKTAVGLKRAAVLDPSRRRGRARREEERRGRCGAAEEEREHECRERHASGRGAGG